MFNIFSFRLAGKAVVKNTLFELYPYLNNNIITVIVYYKSPSYMQTINK